MAKSKKKTPAKKKSSSKKNTPVAAPKDPVIQNAEASYARGDFASLRKIAKEFPDNEAVKSIKAKADTETPVWLIGLVASCIVLCAAALTLTTG